MILILITATSMQLVRIPWAHIHVRVKLDILETDKTAMVSQKNQQARGKKCNQATMIAKKTTF